MPTKAQLEERIEELTSQLEDRGGQTESALLKALPPADERTPWIEAKAQVALALARQIDETGSVKPSDFKGPPPNISAMVKELGACIDRLEVELGDDDGPSFFDALPSAVGDSAKA